MSEEKKLEQKLNKMIHEKEQIAPYFKTDGFSGLDMKIKEARLELNELRGK